MSNYTYYFYDLVANTAIEQLPIMNVTFSSRLNDIGRFEGELKLTDSGVRSKNWISALKEGRTAIYVDDGGAIVWSGILWTSDYTSEDGLLRIGGLEWLSYFKQQRFLVAGRTYTAVDPFFVPQDLISWAQAQSGGNIGVNVTSGLSGSATTISQTYNTWDLKNVGDAIVETAQLNVGFDFAHYAAWSGGIPVKTLLLGYPRLGAAAAKSGLVWEYPGANLVKYGWQRDATVIANTIYEQGAGSGATTLQTTVGTPSQIDGGYPLLEAVVARKDVTDANVLHAFAVSDAAFYANPLPTVVLWARAEMVPVLGSYSVGDDARLRIGDWFYPPPSLSPDGLDHSLDAVYRIQEIEVSPQDEQRGEQVKLTLGLPPPAVLV